MKSIQISRSSGVLGMELELVKKFERGRIIELREGGYSVLNITERLSRNVSTVKDCWYKWTRDDTALRRPDSGHVGLLKMKTAVFGVRLWRIVLRMWQKLELELVPQ
ncbi:uncharacterized protein TNCV_298311 [Trichonephila clavipes]|nr:uncharacterized protein TNCV_298311 [Trichonephila clavipes]